MNQCRLMTSESVTEGHPDKLADQISDHLVDAYLKQDAHSKTAIEVLLTHGLCIVAGEVTSKAQVPISKIVQQTIENVGYTSGMGFSAQESGILVSLGEQSSDIALGVGQAKGIENPGEQGAGDQGIMFGYAVNESSDFMPWSLSYAHALSKKLSQVRKSGKLPWLRPDGKTQVTIMKENQHMSIPTLVVSAQHHPDISYKEIHAAIMEEVIYPTFENKQLIAKTRCLINPTGRFVTGGPSGDCGLTGRKIIVDTYGGHAPHGGGAFSGKDPSKVDRSAAYMMRLIAKTIVASKLAQKALIQVGYAIGVAEPVSLNVETFGTSKLTEEAFIQKIKAIFKLTPRGIIEQLELLAPIYAQTASYGHFGQNAEKLPWETLKYVDTFTQA